ncbi:hypothetical protein FOZ61_006807 [Perkinsus olseni]|uniref:Uncharacterized protein n=1 Tax=Perkinsus olseni TaxID=32597 RepID=A0A7J6MHB1_PEROL|nr:hypothetical protein FOZ61_006807 [Perkinsus olseni]KAF4676051.1 hypothetical protein FOL46_007929 [Perkinsus olseni]
MRSTAAPSSATAAVLGALMLQSAAATNSVDYACHIRADNSTVPTISCCIASKSRGLFDLGEPKWLPRIYSEHAVETDEDGVERYVSSSCIVHPDLKDGKPYMGADNTCGIDWLRDAEHMLSSFSDRKIAVGECIPERFWDLWGKPPGEAFFFKFGSSAWPGEYALFLKFNEEAFILFNETDRVRRRASANLASTSG